MSDRGRIEEVLSRAGEELFAHSAEVRHNAKLDLERVRECIGRASEYERLLVFALLSDSDALDDADRNELERLALRIRREPPSDLRAFLVAADVCLEHGLCDPCDQRTEPTEMRALALARKHLRLPVGTEPYSLQAELDPPRSIEDRYARRVLCGLGAADAAPLLLHESLQHGEDVELFRLLERAIPHLDEQGQHDTLIALEDLEDLVEPYPEKLAYLLQLRAQLLVRRFETLCGLMGTPLIGDGFFSLEELPQEIQQHAMQWRMECEHMPADMAVILETMECLHASPERRCHMHLAAAELAALMEAKHDAQAHLAEARSLAARERFGRRLAPRFDALEQRIRKLPAEPASYLEAEEEEEEPESGDAEFLRSFYAEFEAPEEEGKDHLKEDDDEDEGYAAV